MKKIEIYEEIEKKISENRIIILYFGTEDCGVCHVDEPKVKEIALKNQIKVYKIDPLEISMSRGRFDVFISPVVTVYLDGKEIHRQARIIDFKELEYRILQIKEAL